MNHSLIYSNDNQTKIIQEQVNNCVIPQVVRRLVFSEWGGTETVVWNTAQQLQKMGIQSEVLTTKALCPKPYEKHENLDIKRFNYQYPYFNLKQKQSEKLDKKGGNPFSKDLYRYLMNIPELNLIHCHSMQRIAGIVRRASQHRKVPYVLSFHGGHFNVPESEITDMVSSVKHTFHYGRIIDKFQGNEHFIRDADGIICVGYDEFEETSKQYPLKSVIYLPNGVDPKKYALGDKYSFKQKYQIPQNVKLLLNIGRIDPQKNQMALLEILLDLPSNHHLLLVGPATNLDYLEKLKKMIRDYHLQERVHIIPGLGPDDTDLVNAYHAADVFVLPSLHEPFGIVVLEAWASGLPVVTANVGGLKHLIRHGENGFKANEKAEMVQCISKILNQPELYTKLQKQSKIDLMQNYTWDIITQKLFDFYQIVKKNHALNQKPQT